MSIKTLSEQDEAEVRALLEGHRIVQAETGTFEVKGRESWEDKYASGRLTLDDGTQIYVIPNQGGCACSAGDYDLTHLASVDNVITDVRLAAEQPDAATGEDEWWGEPPTSYRIYVIADAVEINAVQIDGNDGNGYYGTGYELIVTRAQVTA